MKQLSLLKTLVNILFALSIFTMFFAVPFMLISIIMPDTIPFKINGEMAKDVPVYSKLIAFIILGGFACLIYALYIFKKNLALFEKKRVFHADVIANFRKMANSILSGFGLLLTGSVLYSLSLNKLSLSIDFIMEMIFIFAIGLFFHVLGTVFQMAKSIKEENDLTV